MKYKPIDYWETGKTYYVINPDKSDEYIRAVMVQRINDFAVLETKGEKFSVRLTELYDRVET